MLSKHFSAPRFAFALSLPSIFVAGTRLLTPGAWPSPSLTSYSKHAVGKACCLSPFSVLENEPGP